jgi:predicted nucleic acid-binding protein
VAIGLDTSVVVRLLLGAPKREYAAALARLEEAYSAGETALVSDLVLIEAFHALSVHYGVPRKLARERLVQLARSGVVQLDPPEALDALRERGGGGLTSRAIHERYRALRASTLTLSPRQGSLEGVVKLVE